LHGFLSYIVSISQQITKHYFNFFTGYPKMKKLAGGVIHAKPGVRGEG